MEPYRIFLAETDSPTAIWELHFKDIELIAGMLAAGVGILSDLNSESNYNHQAFPDDGSRIASNSKSMEYYLDSDADVSDFRLDSNVMEDNLSFASVGQLANGEYGIWLRSNRPFHYDLYRFSTNSFFQGIVTICNAFGVDFRNYIYGFPFDGHGNQYALSGYVMSQYQVGQDAPDIDDIEEEEAGDENINEPFARTDDIITLKD